MSLFPREDRDKARPKGGAEDFVKVTAGDVMQFRVTKVGRVRMAEDAPNGPFECFPFEVDVRWIDDGRGRRDCEGFRWEPAADKMEGLIEIADKLEELTGNPKALHDHDLIVRVTKEKSRKGNWFFIYSFELVGPWPNGGSAPAQHRTNTPATTTAASTAPAVSRPGAASGPAAGASDDATPEQFLAALRHAFGQCGDLATLEAEARKRWPDAQKARATQGATAAYKEAKLAIAKRQLGAAPTQAALDQVWDSISAVFASDPVAVADITAAYTARQAGFSAGTDAGFPDDGAPPWA